MLIDWFTVGAQALNFVILVWLMKRYLYKPVLAAIDVREKRIATAIGDAETKKADAQKEHDEFDQKNEAFDQERAALLGKATDEVKAERSRMLDEARKTADALTVKRQEALRSDARNQHQAIRHRTQKEVFAIARKALADLATTSLEERLVDVLVRRLRAVDGQVKTDLANALKAEPDAVNVRSAFELPPGPRATLQDALNETFSAQIPLRFTTTPELVGGIELTAKGQKIAWSIDDYLASLEKDVDELLQAKATPEEPESMAKSA